MSSRSLILSLGGVTLLCLAVLLPNLLDGRWTSDDYVLASTDPAVPLPPLAELATSQSGGKYTVFRLLNYPFLKTASHHLGPTGSHLLGALLHGLNGLLVFLSLRKFGAPRKLAVWAVAFFVVCPFGSQAFFWWSSSGTLLTGSFFLGAVLAYLAWLECRHWTRLGASLCLVFVGLSTYELWLAGGVVFLVLAATKSIDQNEGVRGTITRLWPMTVPYIAWLTLVTLTYPDDAKYQSSIDPGRIPVVFLSIHGRILHWFTDKPWGALVEQGLSDPYLIGSLVTGCLGLLLLGLGLRSYRPADNRWEGKWIRFLALAYSFFLGSRLVFVLQGGVALHSRHSYGATISWGIGVALVLSACGLRWPRASLAVGVISLGILAITVRGQAVHMAGITRAEAVTLEAIQKRAEELQTGALHVVGHPTSTQGEMDYFGEGKGMWLRLLLQRNQVKHWREASHDPSGDEPEPEIGVVWRWEAGQLSSHKRR